MAQDLAGYAAELDARRHVTNPTLSRALEELLEPGARTRILFLHGPGGIGKSAALRDLGRRALVRGFRVTHLDGRELGVATGTELSLEQVSETHDVVPLLLLVDEADALGAGIHVLGRALGRLPDSARVVIAARRPPTDRWLPDPLEGLVHHLRVAPLPPAAAEELLRRHGVDDPTRRAAIVTWAMGSPLALVLAATGSGDVSTFDPDRSEDLVRRLAGSVLGSSLDAVDRELLEVAALTWAVDEGLLADVLPGRDPARAFEMLTALTIVERRGPRATLHPLVARAVAERLEVQDPFRFSTLVLRIASVLRDRALAGDPAALPELADLIRDPMMRQGLGPALSDSYYADRIRLGDHDSIRAALGTGADAFWDAVLPLLDRGHAVRDRDDQCVAVAVAFPVATPLDTANPLTGPVAAHVAEAGIAGASVLTPVQLTATGDGRREEVTRFRNAVALQRCGVPNPRYDLVNEIGWSDEERDVMRQYGYAEVTGLRRQVGDQEVRTWLADSGPEGFVGLVFRAVAAEQGADLPAPSDRGDQVLTALDSFGSDPVLADLALAPCGHRPRDAAASVRRMVLRTVDRALAHAPDLRQLVELRYLEPAGSHDEVIRRTFLSRRSYFRKLKEARALIAAAS